MTERNTHKRWHVVCDDYRIGFDDPLQAERVKAEFDGDRTPCRNEHVVIDTKGPNDGDNRSRRGR